MAGRQHSQMHLVHKNSVQLSENESQNTQFVDTEQYPGTEEYLRQPDNQELQASSDSSKEEADDTKSVKGNDNIRGLNDLDLSATPHEPRTASQENSARLDRPYSMDVYEGFCHAHNRELPARKVAAGCLFLYIRQAYQAKYKSVPIGDLVLQWCRGEWTNDSMNNKSYRGPNSI